MNRHQAFSDGVARFCPIVNVAENGRQPEEALGEPFLRVRYDNRAIGIRRMEAIMEGLGQRAEKIIRVPNAKGVETDTGCALEDGEEYRVIRVLDVLDAAPVCYDVALERFELPSRRR
jgi:hypothetical protein